MPSARELLEQADALMRRNRLAPAPRPDDGIPMLTEAVPVPPVAAPAPAPATAVSAPIVYDDLDDVPLLTDAVEEIEAPSILEEPPDIEEPPDFDDPAVWTDTLTGAHSIVGEDRLELPPPVPAAELTTSSRATSPFPSGIVERSAEWDAAVAPEPEASTPNATSATAPLDAPPPSHAPVERTAEPRVAASAASQVPATAFDDRDFEALPRDDAVLPASVHVYDAPPQGPLVFDDVPDEPTVIAATPFETTTVDAPVASPESTAPLERFDSGVEATLPGVAARPVAQPAPAAPTDDEARWAALAEEIRMQVLQRIDLFTDTGLREQLAARLQPIVDRASQDLVATINQHVGVLLRAYVAEAIEREIERWRADRP